MPEILIAVLIISGGFAVWAYLRANRLHSDIEAIHPGFNEAMRKAGWRRKP